jgi:hypothetical protein
MGYAMPLMRRRGWRTSASSLAIGLIWAMWHYVPLLEAGRTPAWIAWWSLGTVAARVIIVWLYDSYFNPAVTGVIEAAIAVAIIIAQEIRRRYPAVKATRSRRPDLRPA